MPTDRIARKRTGRSETISRLAGPFLVVLLIFALVPARPVFGQGTPPTYTFAECENVEENLLLGELNRITRSVLEKEKSGLDITKIVYDNWMNVGMDGTVDAAVDNAVERVREEEGTWARIFSGWSEDKAREFAEKVAAYAFGSPEFREAIDKLSYGIAKKLEEEIHLMTVKSASATLLCVQDFVKTSFSGTMSVKLERGIRDELSDEKLGEGEGQDGHNVPLDHTTTLAGLGTIIGTQIAHKLAQKIAQGILGKVVTRVLGKAASSVIPIAGWIVGGALIVYDLYKAWDGSLPQIQKDFKGESVKEAIRDEITKLLEEELRNSLPEISNSVTLDIFNKWKVFLQEFELVLRLAESNERFRTIVDDVTVDQVDHLTQLVTVALRVLGKEWLIRIIESGEFEQIFELPELAIDILRDEADPKLVLAWADLAGAHIVGVVKTKLYVHSAPSDFVNREALNRVLALEEPVVIEEFMRLSQNERTSLLQLPIEQAQWLFTVLTFENVSWLARYMEELKPSEAKELVAYLKIYRELLNELKSSEDLRSVLPSSLDLATREPKFSQLVFGTPPDQLAKLSHLVSASEAALDADQLHEMIESGQLEQILSLPSAAIEILREKEDPALVIEWGNLAGDSLGQVVETELYVFSLPSEVDGPNELRRILNLENSVVIRKLMELDIERRRSLLDLSPEETRSLILHDILQAELPWLADYIQELPSLDRRLFVNYILKEPALVPVLKESERASADFPRVIDLALRIPEFGEFLFDTRAADIEKLTKLAVVAEDVLSPEDLVKAIESGQFEIILALPQEAFEILQEKTDPALVIRWAELAEDTLVRAVETGLFRVAQPEEFQDKGELDAILALGETAAMEAAMGLDQIDRSVILSLTPERARLLLTSLDLERLTWLIQIYLSHLSGDERELLASHVLNQPDLLSELEHENILESLLESDNKESLLIFLAQRVKDPGPWWPTAAMVAAATAVASGDLPVAFYNHYFSMPSLVLFMVVALVAVLAFVVTRRIRKPVQQLT